MSEPGSSSDAIELSIEETNKLRAKLGLKPLEVDSPSSSTKKDEEVSYEKRGEVFVQTTKISDKLETERLREKIAIQREKRLLAEKLKASSTISEEVDDDDLNPFAWVAKSREADKVKKEQQEQEERNKEKEERLKHKLMLDRQRAYNETHLQGLKVNHSLDKIAESNSVILTLKDHEILDEEAEDELENVNLKDDEKASENAFNRKHGKNDYNPYETQDSLLSKYDEKGKDSFRVGGAFAVSTLGSIPNDEIPIDGRVSLSSLKIKFASEFYTPEEMEAKFKKRKKKVSKKTSLRKTTSDELIDEPSTSTETKDEVTAESDSRPKRKKQKVETQTTSTSKSSNKVIVKQEPMDIDDGLDTVDEELDNYIPGVVDDEAERELEEALEKVRRRKQTIVPSVTDLLSALPKSDPSTAKNEPSTSSSSFSNNTGSCIILDSTAEFCRTLGEIESSSFNNRLSNKEDDDDDMDVDRMSQEEPEHTNKGSKSQKSRREGQDGDSESKKSSRGKDKWQEVDVSKNESTLYEKLKSQPILEEEPDLTQGVGAALQLAYKKGYLDKEAKKSASVPMKHPELLAKGYSIEEKFREDDRRGHRGEGRGYSGGGQVSDFKEKSNYKPDVKLEYVDDNGRILNQKEAFRVLSHKFHGKGPGKNKVDKRMKKHEQESKLRQMSCIDTPLNTVEKLREKQKEIQLPYVVLSGTGSSLVKK